MEIAVRMARIGSSILSLIAFMMIVVMTAYGGYSLWDSYMVNQGGFLSDDLLKYKPNGDPEVARLSLEELMAINEDVLGWLTIDDTHIDYPVVQGETDMEYINKGVMGDFALAGSIFLSCLNTPDFTDRYNLVYGHHMDNGGMFGDVLEFVDSQYFESHQAGVLFLTDRTFDIELFACIEADGYDKLIYRVGPEYGTEELLDYLKASSTQYRDIGVTPRDQLIAFSTCVDAATNGRVVLYGRLNERETQEGGVAE